MYDADEERDEEPGIDWDAWERNRMTGWTRWWMILMAATTVALTIRFLQGDGSFLP